MQQGVAAPLPAGSAFPALTLSGLDGHAAPLSAAWADGEALVTIGHSSCRTTRLVLPYLDRLHRRRPAGVRLLAVLQDTPEEARSLREKLHLDLPLLLEADPYPLAAAAALRVVPTLFVVGRDGRVVLAFEAFRRAVLESLAARWGSPALFEASDPTPALRPG